MKPNLYNKLKQLSPRTSWFVAFVGALVLISSVGYGVYSYNFLQKEKLDFLSELLSELEDVKKRNLNLLQETRYQQSIIDSFNGQIQSISSTVGTLEKLSQTDPELLKKYSKIYFLNENYRPAKLAMIEPEYLYNKEITTQIHLQVLPYLENLLLAAREDNVELLIASAFRSFQTQASLKSEYTVIYGAGTANQFSADQGYSEHQLGTAVDFTTLKVGGEFSKFKTDPAYEWLKANAYKYGFVVSYPEENTYYKFEPWHWRFVGIELAKRLYIDKEYFYDLGQREIDAYLVKLFD